MASLELSRNTILDSDSSTSSGVMQRSARGMGRAQHREPNSPDLIAASQDTHNTQPTSRSTARNNPKLKVLVRSHAMREETSPPREPTPPLCISIITSPPASSPVHSTSLSCRRSPSSPGSRQNSNMTLSPSLSPGNSSRCSPTLLQTSHPPNYHSGSSGTTSPINQKTTATVQHIQDNSNRANSTKYINTENHSYNNDTATVRTQDSLNSFACKKINGSQTQNVEINISDESTRNISEDDEELCAVTNKISISDNAIKDKNNSSPTVTSSNQKSCVKIIDSNFRTKSEQNNYNNLCECFNQVCTKCSKNNERNINNNLRDNINNNTNNNNNNNVIVSSTHSSNTLTVSRANTRHKLRHQSSSQGSFEGSSSSPCLSRDNSTEQYTDCTGIDLQKFIIDTLNKNSKDRALMLKIEQELVNLAKDKSKSYFKFPMMSSYQRMLVHRCAAYFGMDHNIETSGKCVVVNKTKNTRIPDRPFKDHIREDYLFPEEPRRSILKRDSNSFEDCNYKSPDRHMGLENRRSKSFEEREEEYEKARRRIFKDGTMQECDSQEDFMWADMPWPEAEPSKIRLLPPDQPLKNRLLKVQSVDNKSETLRPCVAKSYSFGGYGGTVSVLSRGDSVTSTHSAGPRLLTKQDSNTSTISWRLSPSSSGYKSQSQRSDSVTPSPTATPLQLSDISGKNSIEEPMHGSITEETDLRSNNQEKITGDNQLLWAVTDMQSVPKGSILINPQTGQPFTNQDGSIYHFDPSNPPPGFEQISKPPPSPVKLISPHKSPVKEVTHSPKKIKTKSPTKNKGLINSATSPIQPCTPPTPQGQSIHNVPYVQSSHMENATNMPIQPYPVYPNGYVPGMPSADTNIPVYQQPVGMMFAPYGVPPQYENRPETNVTDMSGYFVNMAVSDPNCTTQPVSYQPPPAFWNQQPISYYPPPTNQQRFPVQLSVAGQLQGSYVPTPYPPNYVPVPQPQPAAPPTTELVPVYNTSQIQMLYPPPQQNPNPMFVQNPNPVVFAQNAYPQNYPSYPPNTPTPSSTTNSTYSTQSFGMGNAPNQCFNQMHSTGYDGNISRNNTPKNNCNKSHPKLNHNNQSQQSSNHSSGGSNSPANTVISGYFANPNGQVNYRQCTPPDSPASSNLAFGYPPNFMQQSMIFRPMGSIRASPPINIRSSRSPTPGPDFPQVGSLDRSQRYSVGSTTVYNMGVPCIFPGDVRLVPGRAQPPNMFKPPYRQTQTFSDNSNKPHNNKTKKSRTKVPALPPSGRQQSQPASTHSRY